LNSTHEQGGVGAENEVKFRVHVTADRKYMLVSNTDEVELSSHKKNLNASFD